MPADIAGSSLGDRLTLGQDISKEVLIEALEALRDGIAIYDENDVPMYVSGPSRRGFGPFFRSARCRCAYA